MDLSHTYGNLSPEEQEELFSHYLISNWSYSKVTQFARNEKAFEKQYIYGVYDKNSATTIAGQAYHHALAYFFNCLKDGGVKDIVDLEASAFEYIDEVPANCWKIQKSNPTIEECRIDCTKKTTALLKHFLKEVETYTEDIAEVLFVEKQLEAFIKVNGVDIPLPCVAKIDLIVKTKSGKVAIIDHKSKAAFTPEEEMKLAIGVQAITYVLVAENRLNINIDEVWFVENKYSTNKDNKPQLNAFKLDVNANARKLYEALLYEPLKRTLDAVSNPDYIYLINESDNFTDKAELYDFWARTMVCEVEDFNVEESKKDLVAKRLKKVRDSSISTISPNVIKKFRENANTFIQYDLSNKNMTQEEKIEHQLRSFGIIIKVAHKLLGFSCNTYLLELSAGTKVGSIYSHRLDIANALDVANVRISNELVVYQNKSYLGIEVNKTREMDLLFDEELAKDYKIPLGKDNLDNVLYWDLNNQTTPHILVCGATGSGKSVFLKSTIEYAKIIGVDDIVIFDPKFEFRSYHNNNDCNVYSDIEEIEEQMKYLVLEMEQLVKANKSKKTLVIFDEYADAFDNSRKGKALGNDNSLEKNLKMLTQKGRSAGFRVIATAQRASTKVITGDIKVNFSTQICFMVQKAVDSKVVIDEIGAENLIGNGDGLIKSPMYKQVTRFQAFYKK